MKLPAVAIAAAFACGIALGLHPAVLPHVTSVVLQSACFPSALILIVAGLALARTERFFPCRGDFPLELDITRLSRSLRRGVTSLLEQKRLSLESPRRWHGRLHDALMARDFHRVSLSA